MAEITIERLIELIKKSDIQIDYDKVDDSVVLSNIGIDSLDMMNLLLAVQEETGIDIPDGAVESLKTLGQIRQFISREQ